METFVRGSSSQGVLLIIPPLATSKASFALRISSRVKVVTTLWAKRAIIGWLISFALCKQRALKRERMPALLSEGAGVWGGSGL